MVFDALDGVFIALFSVTAFFSFDAGTFEVAAILFATVTIASDSESVETDREETRLHEYIADLRIGVDAFHGTLFIELTALTALANFTTGVALTIFPALGDKLGGPALYGLMLGALGNGRFVGSLIGPRVETAPVLYHRLFD